MKRIKIFYLFVITAPVISSCDYVETPYPEQTAQPASCDPPVFDTNSNTNRNVLIEDFTGHRCPNCPYAGYVALQEQANQATSGNHLIIVSIHATDLAEPQTNPDGSFAAEFRTEAGDNFGNLTNSYSEYFGGATGFAYVPIGLIDRAPYNSNVPVDVGDWSNAINDRFSVPIGANLQMSINYDQAFNKACIYIETEFAQNLSGDYNLVVYIVEDSIVDWQTMGATPVPGYPTNQDIDNYMQRHVFRGTANGTWGTQIATGGVTIGETVVTGFDIDLDPSWDPDHISFVAYVYDDATKEILQAIEEELIP